MLNHKVDDSEDSVRSVTASNLNSTEDWIFSGFRDPKV